MVFIVVRFVSFRTPHSQQASWHHLQKATAASASTYFPSQRQSTASSMLLRYDPSGAHIDIGNLGASRLIIRISSSRAQHYLPISKHVGKHSQYHQFHILPISRPTPCCFNFHILPLSVRAGCWARMAELEEKLHSVRKVAVHNSMRFYTICMKILTKAFATPFAWRS
jgi:hypothetical protein